MVILIATFCHPRGLQSCRGKSIRRFRHPRGRVWVWIYTGGSYSSRRFANHGGDREGGEHQIPVPLEDVAGRDYDRQVIMLVATFCQPRGGRGSGENEAQGFVCLVDVMGSGHGDGSYSERRFANHRVDRGGRGQGKPRGAVSFPRERRSLTYLFSVSKPLHLKD